MIECIQAYIFICWIFPHPQICPSLCLPSHEQHSTIIPPVAIASNSDIIFGSFFSLPSHPVYYHVLLLLPPELFSLLLQFRHFHICLLSPWHLPSWLSASNPLLFPNPFSKTVASLISNGEI